MPPTSRVSRPSIARTIHQRAGSQAPTTPIKSSPLARSSTPTPPKAAASPQLSSRSATPSSRNSIILGDSPGKALPLTDTAPDLNDYVRLSHPSKANLILINHLHMHQIEKRFTQMDAAFERGADQLLQRSQYERRRPRLRGTVPVLIRA